MEKTRVKRNHKKILAIFYDCIMTAAAAIIALWITEGYNVSIDYTNVLIYLIPLIGITIVSFASLKLYDSLWKYAGMSEIVKIFIGVLIVFFINVIVAIVTKPNFFTYSWCFIVAMLQVFFTFLSRFFYRFTNHYFSHKNIPFVKRYQDGKTKVMIIGGGAAGASLIREMQTVEELNMLPLLIIDDDLTKLNQYICGLKIAGNRNDIISLAKQYEIDRIVIAIPSADPQELAKIIMICKETKCKIQTLPGIYQLVGETVLIEKIRDVQIEDLLGREQIKIIVCEITSYIRHQVVLVTGGGGSIGSELCRQIAKSLPKKLIIFDFYENNAYDIEQELKHNFPNLDLLVLIGNVRDEKKIKDVFAKYKPDIVYHAAAHKHVPLMETSPIEAVKNNVFGTLNVARAADEYGTKRFIFISTDKAVRPTNIMGATKRICEMIVQTIDKHSKTEFVAVRFGNVLGSNGSVIPLFKKQIEFGGPVTVTHRDITRYFMTIPEAVSLVLQAGSYAKGGEIFVLDMGKPVRIYELAENLIKLSGYIPNVDIDIEITGLRPGEKLYEELLMEEEGLQNTENKLIYIGKPIELDEKMFYERLAKLHEQCLEEKEDMLSIIKDLVPQYQQNGK
ncbi:MAG TPA: nucleoside-diphosphate sugar epimerase/dehydratase [Bacilli bacterium]|nr:nucleoside-diphosphate sugar epimerase/dehydratase [Bacilli bacterium]